MGAWSESRAASLGAKLPVYTRRLNPKKSTGAWGVNVLYCNYIEYSITCFRPGENAKTEERVVCGERVAGVSPPVEAKRSEAETPAGSAAARREPSGGPVAREGNRTGGRGSDRGRQSYGNRCATRPNRQ